MYKTPRIDQINAVTVSYADNATLMRISYSKAPRPAEVMTLQKTGATIAIDANGGTSSELLITLVETTKDENGTAAASVTNTINGNTYDTIAKVVDQINTLEGYTAWVTDAPFSHDTGTDAFVDLAATAIPEAPSYLDCLKRSVATANPVYKRLGQPTERDNGYIKLISAITSITSGTAGNIEVGVDNGTDAYQILDSEAATATVKTAYLDAELMDAPTYQGALLFTYSATSLSGAVLTIRHQNANL